jgi:hypothetical protein
VPGRTAVRLLQRGHCRMLRVRPAPGGAVEPQRDGHGREHQQRRQQEADPLRRTAHAARGHGRAVDEGLGGPDRSAPGSTCRSRSVRGTGAGRRRFALRRVPAGPPACRADGSLAGHQHLVSCASRLTGSKP